MPRREQPLVDGDESLLAFAAQLRRLREKAGSPTYRELSTSARYSITVLSEAASGRKLPTLAVTLAYVAACGGDTDEWRERWRATADELAAPPVPEAAEQAPYLGLAAFQTTDARRFFGRDRLVQHVVAQVHERRFVGVFGASGSGKSSLLRAGLVATVGTDGLDGRTPRIVVFTPGPRPREECALRLAELTGHLAGTLRAGLAADPENLHVHLREAAERHGSDLLLVVDQFEEVFTLCGDTDERAWFVNALVQAATAETTRARVVIGVRADFYSHCAQYPALVDALQDGQVLVGPMSTDELRLAITQPAVVAGCTVETALVSRLTAEAAGQPAALPLVSHALVETWRRRRGTRLTLVGYEETGGIQHAIARSAEEVFTAFTAAQRDVAKQVFLRLTALGEGTEDTKRRIRRDTLDDDADTATVLETLAGTRLVTLDDSSVEITHETLIRCWPRLREWLADDREGLRLHRQLADATEVWESVDRDPGALHRGVRLELARDWADTHEDALTGRERDFLTASLGAQAAEQAAASRAAGRLHRLVALLTVLLLVATGAVVYAVGAQNIATAERNLAIARNAAREGAAIRATNPTLSVQLSVAAYRLATAPETRDNLLSAFATPYSSRLPGFGGDVVSLAFSPDSRTLATGSADDTAVLWDVTDDHRPARLTTLTLDAPLKTVAFGAGGSVLVTVTSSVRLWDVTDPRSPVELSAIATSGTAAAWTAAFSPDGRMLSIGYEDGTTRLWDVTDVRHAVEIAMLAGHTGPVTSTAFSPDGRLFVTTGDHAPRLWDITTPRASRLLGVLTGHTNAVMDAAFSPDGRTLATASWDHDARLWDVSDPDSPRDLATLTDNALAWYVAFSPDGTTLATSGSSIRLWDITDLTRPREILSVPGGTIAMSPDGTKLAYSAGNEGRLYDLREQPLYGHSDQVSSVAFRPDGRLLATGSWDQTVRLWQVTNPGERWLVTTITAPEGFVRSVTFGPDGRTLAAASDDGTLRLWDVTVPRKPRELATVRHPVSGEALWAAFSPDGRTLATTVIGAAFLWDVTDPAAPRLLAHLGGVSPGVLDAAVFSPDGRTLALTSDGTDFAHYPGPDMAHLWDVTDPHNPRELWFPFGRTDAVRPGAFSPDGRILATVGNDRSTDSTVRLVDMSDPLDPRRLATLTGHLAAVGSVAFSPDGKRLATISADTTMKLWDIADPDEPALLATFSTRTGTITSVTFSPDGRTLATGSVDHINRLWETDVDAVAARVCEVAYPRITDQEWDRYFPGLPYMPPCPA